MVFIYIISFKNYLLKITKMTDTNTYSPQQFRNFNFSEPISQQNPSKQYNYIETYLNDNMYFPFIPNNLNEMLICIIEASDQELQQFNTYFWENIVFNCDTSKQVMNHISFIQKVATFLNQQQGEFKKQEIALKFRWFLKNHDNYMWLPQLMIQFKVMLNSIQQNNFTLRTRNQFVYLFFYQSLIDNNQSIFSLIQYELIYLIVIILLLNVNLASQKFQLNTFSYLFHIHKSLLYINYIQILQVNQYYA
ncbi:hypothetical protein pb186bvf_010859 [Paramecium bursaria]